MPNLKQQDESGKGDQELPSQVDLECGDLSFILNKKDLINIIQADLQHTCKGHEHEQKLGLHIEVDADSDDVKASHSSSDSDECSSCEDFNNLKTTINISISPERK